MDWVKQCSYFKISLTWPIFGVIKTSLPITRVRSYSVRMRENTDQNNSGYGHILRSVVDCKCAENFLNYIRGLTTEVNKALIFEIAKMIIFVIANVNKEKHYM